MHLYSHCTALNIWSAMHLIWFSEKGMNPFSFRKSYVLSPSSSNTMQMWPWWSNQSSIRTQALKRHWGKSLWPKTMSIYKVFLHGSQTLTISFPHQASLSAQAHQPRTRLPHGSAQYFWWSSAPLLYYFWRGKKRKEKKTHTRYVTCT